MAKGNIGKVVEISWEDAWSNSSVSYNEESIAREGEFKCFAYGLVIRDNEQGITVARENFPGNHEPYRSVQHIPRQMVRKVRVLK